MTSKNIIKAITALIKPVCGAVFFGRSPVKYPKICCDLRELMNDGCKHGFRLVLDFYSDDGDFPAGHDMADAVRAALTNQHGDIDGGYMMIYLLLTIRETEYLPKIPRKFLSTDFPPKATEGAQAWLWSDSLQKSITALLRSIPNRVREHRSP